MHSAQVIDRSRYLLLGNGQRAQPGGLLRRMAARAFDWAIQGFTAFAALYVAALFNVHWMVSSALAGQRGPWTDIEADGPDLLALMSIVFAAIVVLLVVLYETATTRIWGKTIGKVIVGIQVVNNSDGLKPLFGQALVRWVVPMAAGCAGAAASAIGLSLSVGVSPLFGDVRRAACLALGIFVAQCLVYSSSIWDPDGRGWHDKAADTAVIRTRW